MQHGATVVAKGRRQVTEHAPFVWYVRLLLFSIFHDFPEVYFRFCHTQTHTGRNSREREKNTKIIGGN